MFKKFLPHAHTHATAEQVYTVEEAIEKLGFGFFQVLVTVFSGLLWVSLLLRINLFFFFKFWIVSTVHVRFIGKKISIMLKLCPIQYSTCVHSIYSMYMYMYMYMYVCVTTFAET